MMFLFSPLRRTAVMLITVLCPFLLHAQLASRLQQAYRNFLADDQMKYAVTGFYVSDDKGNTIYQHQADYGLAPASTLKVVTAAAALDILGADYRFETLVGYNGSISNGVLQGDLLLKGSGDPTLCTWRYPSMPDTAFFYDVLSKLRQKGVKQINGGLASINLRYSPQAIPGGWIYDDMGNYYGAGTWSLNYRENQFDALFDTRGGVGANAPLKSTKPSSGFEDITSMVTVGAAGSGDNSIIYSSPYAHSAYATGTLGKGNAAFTISGSVPDGEKALLQALADYLRKNGIMVNGEMKPASYFQFQQKAAPAMEQTLSSWKSVSLDSVVYWFLQKSVNSYGEALTKKLAYEKKNWGDTETGVELVREYWSGKGIDRHAIHTKDGSGLSPQNRVTAKALTQVLLYARNRPWFKAFYDGLPLIHDIKMKSGTIGGAKAYTGYITDASGNQYVFGFMVNNFSGNASTVMQKMWQVLDTIVKNRS